MHIHKVAHHGPQDGKHHQQGHLPQQVPHAVVHVLKDGGHVDGHEEDGHTSERAHGGVVLFDIICGAYVLQADFGQ